MKNRFYILLTLLFAVVTVFAQQKQEFTMEGTIFDNEGETIPGAAVYVKDRVGMGTTSDMDGKFRIKAFYGDAIVFSFVGYDKVEHLVTAERKDLIIRFHETAQKLDEVVVVGMGSQRKISSVAAISSVDVKDLQAPSV